MDRLAVQNSKDSIILKEYQSGSRCIVICPTLSRTELAVSLDSTANSMGIPKGKGINTHVNKTETAQLSKLEDRRLTVWSIKTIYNDKHLSSICQYKYDHLFIRGLKHKDITYVLSTVGRYCISHSIDPAVIDDDSTVHTLSSDETRRLTTLLGNLELDTASISTGITSDSGSITSTEFMREMYDILDENYSHNENIRRSTLLSKSTSKTVPKPTVNDIKSKCNNITVEQCTVTTVPRTVTKYMKRLDPGSTIVALTSISSSNTAGNEEHQYYIDSISRLNKGRVYTSKKSDSTDDMDCIFIYTDSSIRPSNQYRQLIYIVDDPGRCRTNYSKKFGQELHSTVHNILQLDVQKIILICNQYYSGYYTINNNVQVHPISTVLERYSSTVQISKDIHSKYSIPTKCTPLEFIKSSSLTYTVTPMRPALNSSTTDQIVEHLVHTLECPYDEETANCRWYSMDTNVTDTYYTTTGLIVEFSLKYRSSAGYLYSTDLSNLLVAMLFYGLRTNGIFIDSSTGNCYLINR